MKPKMHRQYAIVITSISILAIVSVFLLVWCIRTQNSPKASPVSTQSIHASEPVKSSRVLEQSPPPFTPDYSLPPAVNGLAPVITRLSTKQKIVFLGIDDGAFKDPSVVSLLQQNHIKATLFLSRLFINSNPEFFKQITAQGSVIEDHTLDHDTNMTRTESYAQQKNEICGMADYEAQIYGRRPTLFRPPGGAYSDTMRKAAYDCGMKAVVTWIAKANGGAMQYQIGKELHPGDIVLMHFRPEFKQDLQAFVDAETAAGVHTELLESIPGVM